MKAGINGLGLIGRLALRTALGVDDPGDSTLKMKAFYDAYAPNQRIAIFQNLCLLKKLPDLAARN
jgi:hypothetical protein